MATAPVPESQLAAHLAARGGPDAEVLVVAPASELSRLDWLANAEDDARGRARERAEGIAEAAPTDDVDSRVGDSDPVQAIEDALRAFPADELLIVTRREEDAGWLESGTGAAAFERFALPMSHLVVDDDPGREPRAGTS